MYDQWTLANGLRIVGEKLPHLRSVSVGVWIRVGSMMESLEENGLSHFMEHMVFKGTQTRSARQIAEEMDAVGGQLNAFTSKDCTCFYAKVIDSDLPLAVDILSDLTLNATLDNGELQKERGVILEEIAMVEDTPEDLVHDLLSQAQFGATGLGMPILGPASRIEAYSRQDLANFRASHYRPENVVISLAGNYQLETVKELIEKYFGAWQGQGQPEMPKAQQPSQGVRLAREKDTEQVHICLGYPGKGLGSDDAYPVAVFNNLLGGGMSSRLFQRIREELGMAYSIYTYPGAYPGCGTFNVYAGTSPKHAQTVLEQIEIQMKKLLAEGINDKEFQMGKAQLRGAYILGLESAAGRIQSIGRGELLLQHPPTPEETIAKIDRVEKEDVMRVAQEILAAKPCAAIVGKQAEKYIQYVG
ncbi:MAG: insulinase family protein [Clostridia bacterium]|nr:insulinase family protein [Clostridia bacterium]